MLNENQLKLLRHLSRFNLLDYPSCLDMLNNDGGHRPHGAVLRLPAADEKPICFQG